MCRMIMAVGRFAAHDILDAAVAMSIGCTANHDGPTRCHPNGWGAVWRQYGAGCKLESHRDVRAINESVADLPAAAMTTDFLSVHVRHATLEHTHGLAFTHPLERHGRTSWFFMHNGYMPTVYQLLGLGYSRFDSAEYLDYVVDPDQDVLDEAEVLKRLDALAPGSTSANAIAVNRSRAYVVHWTPRNTVSPRYYTMWMLRMPDLMVVASEVVPALAPHQLWQALRQRCVLEFPLDGRVSNEEVDDV